MTEVRGMEDLYRVFSELPKATGKAALRAVAKDALTPMAEDAERRAPRRTGLLQEKIEVKPPKRGRTIKGRRFEGPQAITMAMGPTGAGIIRGQMQEFGTYKEPAQPFMRPAWDSHADSALDNIKTNLWDRMMKATERHQRKLARTAAKAGSR
jgi:HK97 gp10 family phage protein